jgi:hypothetical protein
MTGDSEGWRTSSYSSYNGNCVEVGSWRKSSRSIGNGECLEVGLKAWRKSSRCASGECVEVGQGCAVVAVRDTKNAGTGPVLAFTADSWQRFTASLKAGPGR